MDGRRRRYVMHDVYFLDDVLGSTVFEMFGACGVALWMGFIAACKKNHIEGETSYSSEAEALVIFGLPGLRLVDHNGDNFTLEDFWRLLGDHKVIRRRRSARRLHVVCTRWERWQVKPGTRSTDEQKSRPAGSNTDEEPADYEAIRAPETETETETETESAQTLPVDLDPAFSEFWQAYPKKADKGAARRAWKTAAKKTEPQRIVEAARAYAGDPSREDRYTKNPATWLNAESWDNTFASTGDGTNYETPAVRFT